MLVAMSLWQATAMIDPYCRPSRWHFRNVKPGSRSVYAHFRIPAKATFLYTDGDSEIHGALNGKSGQLSFLRSAFVFVRTAWVELSTAVLPL